MGCITSEKSEATNSYWNWCVPKGCEPKGDGTTVSWCHGVDYRGDQGTTRYGFKCKDWTTPKRSLQSSRIPVSKVKPVAQLFKRTGTKSHGVGCKKTTMIIGGIIATSSLSPWNKVKRLDEGSVGF